MPRSKDVDDWFARIEHPLASVMQQVRKSILAADPRIEECIKWQTPTFTYQGNIASFNPRAKAHVSLMFHTGARIPGEHPRLEGGGDTARYMKIADKADAKRVQRDLRALVAAWCAWKDEGGGKARKKAAKKTATRKKAAAKKTATGKKAAAKKTATRKKTAAKKAAAKKKTAARKTATRKKAAAKKTAAKKTATKKKTAAKKTATRKKTATKKTATGKKAAARKTVAKKKAAAKKSTARKATARKKTGAKKSTARKKTGARRTTR